MSQFTRIQTKIRNLADLEQALKKLGWSYQIGHFQVSDYYGNQINVEVLVRTGKQRDIGYRLVGECYEMVGDWWGMPGHQAADFQATADQMEAEARAREIENEVRRQYAYQVVKDQLGKLATFTLAEETTEADGAIKLVVRRWS